MSTNNNAGCLFAIFKLFSKSEASTESTETPAAEKPPFCCTDSVLTNAERAFFDVLMTSAAEHLIFSKIRLLDLLEIPKGTKGRQAWQNRTTSKHVDFVLCDRTSTRPLLVIELDDSSHRRTDRQARDAFVDRALAAAELPILHVPVRAKYDAEELRAQIRAKLDPSAS